MSILKRTAAMLLASAAILSGTAGALSASALETAEAAKTAISINAPTFKKLSAKKIRIYWSGSKDDRVAKYYVQRAEAKSPVWKTIKTIASDGDRYNGKNYYTDVLKSSEPQRYRYRIKVKVADSANYKAVAGKAIYASNVRVCVDPGHFLTQNGGTYDYTEAESVLKIGLELQQALKERGIDVYMTRTDENMTLGGEENTDSSDQLFARGTVAKAQKCDFFISLHTNANSYNANDCDTLDQPKYINKTMVFVNRVGYNEYSKRTRKLANYIGKYVTAANKAHGVYTCGWTSSSNPTVYTDDDKFTAYNDGLKKKGHTIYRKWGANDYYAVLRGAAYVGVPGILVEHAYHTYPGYCYAFMNDSGIASDYAEVEAKAMLKYLF